MARRSGRGLVALLTLGLLAACSPSGPGVVGSTTSLEVTTSQAAATTSTTMLTATSTATPAATTTTADPVEVDAEVVIPDGSGPFPSVVLVHGGGWVTGNPALMRPLADYLGEHGFLTVNTRYSLADFEHAAFPEAVDDVACAVRFAASLEGSDGTVAVIGHSAGAHIGALVALVGDRYGTRCPHEGTGLPERFIGLAGPYDVSRLGVAIVPFFGSGPNQSPEVWDQGNPLLNTDENPDSQALLIYGEDDALVDESFAIDFHEALTASGASSMVEMVPGADHNDVLDPDLVGAIIVDWLESGAITSS